tara:strand:+ start:24 stop:302 length:279 start_codon:yes stop_codon:yes gene_type:complete
MDTQGKESAEVNNLEEPEELPTGDQNYGHRMKVDLLDGNAEDIFAYTEQIAEQEREEILDTEESAKSWVRLIRRYFGKCKGVRGAGPPQLPA